MARKSPRPTVAAMNRRRRPDERLRAEYIAGAEGEWRKRTGRPMTREALERVLRRYPGTASPRALDGGVSRLLSGGLNE
jgi:hypothetical protein